uniref:Kinesin motor domain-containing protein n=1 Tax=Tanacetum cinerariifolium TaxID=118510 RepID=A0A6L2JFQ5_TANCI|nr:hypothetical protein [Tanacetum cinerariifolium]
MSNRRGIGSQFGRLTKFEFPKFYGEDVQGWLYKVNKFFLLDSILDVQKVRLVSMHMFDKALNWHKQFIRKNGDNVALTVYEREVKNHFDFVFEDPMVELKILKHVTIVQLYQEKFEALMNMVELSEAYEVSLFIVGLKDEISMHVRMFKQNTLLDVYCLAKMQEATLQEIADKRAKNLCFYCDEKFVLGHKCSGQLFLLEICANKSASKEYELEPLLDEPVVQNFGESITNTPIISLNAMNEGNTYKTMRVKAYVGKHIVYSLIDYRSTHIFLDLKVAKKLGCKLKSTYPMDVSVAKGQVMSSFYEGKDFTWTLQGVKFTSDVFILPLGGCELVLAVEWLSILGEIKWNFKDLIMDFVYNDRRMVLRGTQKAALQWMSGKRQSKEISNGQCFAFIQTLCANSVDLARSESAAQALSAGQRLKEGCHINSSLLTLSIVVQKLSKGKHDHVNHRDSKLTHILLPCVGGNARTAIICSLSPAREQAFVKRLQKEMEGLENELRPPAPDNSALLKKKDQQIDKVLGLALALQK